ncbi:MAG: formylglycine-generating enzyme family protein [Phycisphaerae bacterium]|nr:formylglycine-generating enzyme family protein [Phycisphaerae bacterium]
MMKSALMIVLACLALTVSASGGCPSMDFTGDCRVDLSDFALFAEQWMAVGQFQLQVRSPGAPGATITSSTGHGGTANYTRNLPFNTVVSLTAPVVVNGNIFTGWNADVVSTDQTISLTMNDDFHVDAEYTPILGGMVWILVEDPGVPGHEPFKGYVSRFLTTNMQYCWFLNAALASGDITFSGGLVKGAYGSNPGRDFALATYYKTTDTGLSLPASGVTNGGASRIHYNGTSFVVDSGFENHPVTAVSWYGATAFCNYYGYRLPTEWEYQAVADFDGTYTYGYGPTQDSSKLNCNTSVHPDGTTVVGTFGVYGYGLADMTGNLWEFTSSEDGTKRVLRGGGWVNAANLCNVTGRLSVGPDAPHYDYGFRTVKDWYPEDLVKIPAGTFQMGNCMAADEGGTHELPIHSVTVDSFYMGKTEITNQQYCEFMNSALQQGLISFGYPDIVPGPNAGAEYQIYTHLWGWSSVIQILYDWTTFSVKTKNGRDMSQDPVVDITWYGAVAYCNWRSQQEGREPCYDLSTWTCDFSKKGYRLPTEAEWEYAARGGLSGKRFPWGDTISHNEANYVSYTDILSYDLGPTVGSHPTWSDGTHPYTAPVGSFAANGFGLYDVTGNVDEWCNDWYSATYYESSPGDNPTGPATGEMRVIRGGGWWGGEQRISHRYSYQPGFHDIDRGFRVVLNPK